MVMVKGEISWAEKIKESAASAVHTFLLYSKYRVQRKQKYVSIEIVLTLLCFFIGKNSGCWITEKENTFKTYFAISDHSTVCTYRIYLNIKAEIVLFKVNFRVRVGLKEILLCWIPWKLLKEIEFYNKANMCTNTHTCKIWYVIK